MAILEPREPGAVRIECVREIRLGAPSELRDEVARFYCGLLGLPCWSGADAMPGGLGVGPARRGLWIEQRHDPEIDPLRRRLSMTAPSLGELAGRLAAEAWPFEVSRGIHFGDDVLVTSDPAGHRIEVRQSQPI